MRHRLRRALAAVIAMAAVLPALGQPAQTNAMPGTPPPSLTPRSLEETVLIARRMAATATGLPPSTFEVLVAEAVRWADGSIGCPQPGQMYTQALVPGYRVQLRGSDGKVLSFHAGVRGGVIQCPEGRAQAPVSGGADR